MNYLARLPDKVHRPGVVFAVATGRIAVVTVICLALMLAPSPARSHDTLPMIYVVGSDNAILDNHLLEQLRKLAEHDLSVIPLGDADTPLNQAIPIVTIGPRALTATLDKYPQSPVLATLISQEFYRTTTSARSDNENERAVSAIYYGVPLINQALTGKAILPQARKIGLLASPQSTHLYSDLLSQLPEYNLEAQIFVVGSSNQLIPTLVRALYYSDFVLAAQDPVIYNPRTIKHILLTAYRRNIMLIGPSQGYVKAGALASCYSSYSAIAQTLVEALGYWFQYRSLPAPAYPAYFNVKINQQVGRSLSIPLPSEANIKQQVTKQLREKAMRASNGAAADARSSEILP